MVLESDRIRLEQIAIDDYHRLPGILEEFTAKLEELGPESVQRLLVAIAMIETE